MTKIIRHHHISAEETEKIVTDIMRSLLKRMAYDKDIERTVMIICKECRSRINDATEQYTESELRKSLESTELIKDVRKKINGVDFLKDISEYGVYFEFIEHEDFEKAYRRGKRFVAGKINLNDKEVVKRRASNAELALQKAEEEMVSTLDDLGFESEDQLKSVPKHRRTKEHSRLTHLITARDREKGILVYLVVLLGLPEFAIVGEEGHLSKYAFLKDSPENQDHQSL